MKLRSHHLSGLPTRTSLQNHSGYSFRQVLDVHWWSSLHVLQSRRKDENSGLASWSECGLSQAISGHLGPKSPSLNIGIFALFRTKHFLAGVVGTSVLVATTNPPCQLPTPRFLTSVAYLGLLDCRPPVSWPVSPTWVSWVGNIASVVLKQPWWDCLLPVSSRRNRWIEWKQWICFITTLKASPVHFASWTRDNHSLAVWSCGSCFGRWSSEVLPINSLYSSEEFMSKPL